MKAILTKDNMFRTVETLENDKQYVCLYAGGEKYPFNDFTTKTGSCFESIITILIKQGYTLECIEK